MCKCIAYLIFFWTFYSKPKHTKYYYYYYTTEISTFIENCMKNTFDSYISLSYESAEVYLIRRIQFDYLIIYTTCTFHDTKIVYMPNCECTNESLKQNQRDELIMKRRKKKTKSIFCKFCVQQFFSFHISFRTSNDLRKIIRRKKRKKNECENIKSGI